MNIRQICAGTIVLASGLALLSPVPADAQLNGANQNRRNQNARRPAPRNYLPELKTITEGVATRYGVKIVVDPSLFVSTLPKAPDTGLTADKAMDALVIDAKDASWRRVYLSQAQGMIVPAPEKLADSVRALDKLEQSGLVLENPLTGKATTYLKDWAVSPNFKEELAAGQFNATPIYVLYSQHANSLKSPQEELADMQRRSMELMMNLDPDQMAEAMNQGMQMLMNMDPDTRSRFMSMQMQAGMKMMQSMTPEQRNQLLQQSMQAMQQSGGPFGPPPNGQGGRKP